MTLDELVQLWEFFLGYEESETQVTFAPLADRIVGTFDISRQDPSPGRRLRAMAALITGTGPIGLGMGDPYRITLREDKNVVLYEGDPITYAEFAAMEIPAFVEATSKIPYRTGIRATIQHRQYVEGEMPVTARDAELHLCLQDLGYELGQDLHDACFAFDNPDLFYPGVDEGIEPVSDDHVRLVIWASQRELDRELRMPESAGWGSYARPLPAAPLAELPFRIQRAIAERRRFRYQQWGLGQQQWEQNWFSLWDIPEDPDYYPTRWVRHTLRSEEDQMGMKAWLQEQGVQ